ncbi:CHASE2 domain-containing protein [Pontibacterium sp.]|uniref:CHASE2 domain-containing protein n=1 Tax=Pontibacterium sp. TaxID=2036026 RepID=UPI0035199F01
MNQRKIRILFGLVVTLLVLIPVLTGNRPLLLERFELDLYDLRLQQTLVNEPDPRIVIVDVDEKTMVHEGRWPWSRDKVGALVDQLFDQYGVAIVGFDVVFSEPDTQLSQYTLQQISEGKADLSLKELLNLSTYLYPDQRFASAIDARPVVLGFPFDHGTLVKTNTKQVGAVAAPVTPAIEQMQDLPIPTAQGMIGNLPLLQARTLWSGFFDNPSVDTDGVYRRVPLLQRYQDQYYPSLSLAMMMALFGETEVTPVLEADASGELFAITAVDVAGIPIPVDERSNVLVPYRGEQGSFPYVSATDVLRGTADPATLDGAIVLVGTTAAGLFDLRVTPMSNRYPGVEVHANILSGMLDERIRHQPDYTVAVELVQLLISGLLMSLLIPRLSVTRGAILTTIWVSMLVVFNFYAWTELMWVIPLGYTLALVVLLFIFQQTTGYFFETRNRMQLANVFGQYIPPEIVDELNTEGAEAQLQGESRDMTVFFSDIRGFTGLSESLTPQQLTRMINVYLTPMTQVIHGHRGTVDKYIGDAIMAFWGAPLTNPEHPRHALDAAMQMQAEIRNVNNLLRSEGLPEIEVGMGLNTGEMNVGNMGSSFRMAYTVMGDAVNLASRLESLTKFFGVPVLVSGELAERIPEYRFMELDRARVKGRAEPVVLYQPLGVAAELDAAVLAQADQFEVMLADYRAQRWEEALAVLDTLDAEVISGVLIELYRDRIEQQMCAPSEEWDGVHNHDSK